MMNAFSIESIRKPAAVFLLVCVLSMINNVLNPPDLIYHSEPDILLSDKVTSAAFSLHNTQKIKLENTGWFRSYLAPVPHRFFNDNLNLLFLISLMIFNVYISRRSKHHGAYRISLSRMLGYGLFVTSLFLLLQVIRNIYFDRWIRHLTNNQFNPDFKVQVLERPEFWILLLVGSIAWIVRKGEWLEMRSDSLQKFNQKLKQESDLTI